MGNLKAINAISKYFENEFLALHISSNAFKADQRWNREVNRSAFKSDHFFKGEILFYITLEVFINLGTV